MRLGGRSRVVPGLALGALLGSCNLHNAGITPPDWAIAYPQAIALSHEQTPRFMFIANTNYDLRYNGGSVHSYNLASLDQLLMERGCRAADRLPFSDASVVYPDNTFYGLLDAAAPGEDGGTGDAGAPGSLGGMDASIVLPADYDAVSRYGNKRGVLCDGRDGSDACCFDTEEELGRLRASSYRIDSYASGVGVAPDNRRLYVPVQSRNRLVYLDVDQDGRLSCGDQLDRCRRGPGLKSGGDDDPLEDFPGQPSSIVVGAMSDFGVSEPLGQMITPQTTYVAMSHELGGFSIFVEKNGAPIMEDALTDLPQRPTSLTLDPRTRLLYVTVNRQPFFSRVGVEVSPAPSFTGQEQGPRELVYQTSRVFVSGVSQPRDLRDIVFDPNDLNRIYVLIRDVQESVAVLELDPTDASSGARLVDAIRVGDGPSKLAIMVQDGKPFLLASNYDEKSIFVIGLQSRQVEAVVRNLSGPFEMVYDASRRLVYVTDFRVSVVRVVDVAGLTRDEEPPPRIIATLGSPEFEGGLR